MRLKGYSYWLALVVIVLDQLSKWVISSRLELYEQLKVIGNFFVITSIRNTGAAFSILEGKRAFFLLITLAVAAGIMWYIHQSRKSGRTLLLTALGLVLGGALGNFIDRLLYGHVVDFLSFNFGSYSFPVFNLADTAITIGVGLIILDTFLGERRNAASSEADQPGASDSTSGA
ncbi:signal peptidase II [Paenibacillus sp. D51F]|uniref:signal peptidase II n=1 Tax=unclassified Paenibacillus TaxID=185978 RepID=UPI000953D1F3|nr:MULTISPECIES: signal peptidase II [unclassified Paenibacillus]ASS65937.1 lipoprotein signal peptidase [Paenibacillus sp. RUD330]SIQ18159.1 signal peptidase II [Paenibacillus sp. RU4X]SIQ39945.1 signal peptidase II [Paenibacillus sp. RU4T]